MITSNGVFVSDKILYAKVELSNGEKLLLSLINNLTLKTGYCFAKNDKISVLLNFTISKTTHLISRLYKKEILINKGNIYDRKLVLNAKFFPNKHEISVLKKQREQRNKEIIKDLGEKIDILPLDEDTESMLNDYVEESHTIEAEEFKLDSTPLSKAEIKEQFFNNFWAIYPVKVKKTNALKTFKRLNEKDINTLMNILPNIVAYHAQPSTKELFIPHLPHPTTFINGRRWEDEIYKKIEVQTSSDEVVATKEPFADMILNDENIEDFKDSFINGSFENLDKKTQEAIRRTNISFEQFNFINNRIGFLSQIIDFINASVGVKRFPTQESGLIDLFLKSVPNGKYIPNDVFTSTQSDEMFKLFLENGIDFALFRFLKIFGEYESTRG